jgi:hypothetical protein
MDTTLADVAQSYDSRVNMNTCLIGCTRFGTRDDLDMGRMSMFPQTLQALGVTEDLAPLLGK